MIENRTRVESRDSDTKMMIEPKHWMCLDIV